jgi:Flp pilus assembly protein TadB
MEKENNKEQNKDQHKDMKVSEANLTKNQVIIYIIIIAAALTIFILSMVGINLFIMLIIIGAVLIYVYLDKDIQNGEFKDTTNEINSE